MSSSMIMLAAIVVLLIVRSSTSLSTIAVPVKQTSPLAEFDYNSNGKLPWIHDGYQKWNWNGNEINYIEMGDSSKPPLLLIHGFGASVYHFRYNIPVLARDFHVFAFDMLGFGLSSKPIQEYPAEVWRDQTLAFIRDVIRKPVTVAGNSLGGFTALYAASSLPELIPACILLNSAGSFRNPEAQSAKVEPPPVWMQRLQSALERFIIGLSFLYTKQPSRIQEVLKQVYPVSSDQVDDELVESIRIPSLDPNAPEVFFQVVSKTTKRQTYVDDLLENISCPVLLCWGERDPWIRSASADRLERIYPNCKRVSIDAGHCPHDEAPDAVNAAIREFMTEVFISP